MTALTLKLACLRYGHDPLAGPTINSRVSNRAEGIEEMAAMLSSQSQLARLAVVLNPQKIKEAEGLYFVVDGNRRLGAMHKYWKQDADVLVEVFASADHALEASVALNTSLPLHPVDRYRAYAEVMRRDRIDAAQLARRFGVPTKEMQKAMALGALDDTVLDAWLAGEIGADSAAAFTLAASKADQARILTAARKQGQHALQAYAVRQTIIGKKADVAHLVNFVGVDAYRAAGGKLTEDLFDNRHVVHDPAIATKLARDKVAAICADLTGSQDWAWAKPASEMPKMWRHSAAFEIARHPKTTTLTEAEAKQVASLEAERQTAAGSGAVDCAEDIMAVRDTAAARWFGPTAKAYSGCVVGITARGVLHIIGGVSEAKSTAPKKKASSKPASTATAEPEAPRDIPASMAKTLSEGLTRAAATTIRNCKDPLLVCRLLLASLAAPDSIGLGVHYDGAGAEDMLDQDSGVTLLDAFGRTAKYNIEDMLAGPLANYLASSVDLISADPARRLDDGDDAESLLAAIDGETLQNTIRKEFDAAAYFKAAPRPLVEAALKEMAITFHAAEKKSALAAIAAVEAPAVGWLPPQLRTGEYHTAPVSKAGTKAKAKGKGGAKPKAKK